MSGACEHKWGKWKPVWPAFGEQPTMQIRSCKKCGWTEDAVIPGNDEPEARR